MAVLAAALLIFLAVIQPTARGATEGAPLLPAAAGELHSRTDLPGAEVGRGESGLHRIRLREGRAQEAGSGAAGGKRLSWRGGRFEWAAADPRVASAIEPPAPASLEWLPYHATAPPSARVPSSWARS